MRSERATDPNEPAIRLGLCCAALMIAQQVGSKALRDALFLSYFAAAALPRVMIAAAMVSFAMVSMTSRALARTGPARVVPIAFAANGVLFTVEWALLDAAPKPVALALFVHITALGSIVLSGFWSEINERFDPHTAKQAIRRIVAGGTLGGVLGGIGAERIANLIALPPTLLLFAAINLTCAILMLRFAGKGRHVIEYSSASGLAVLRRVPHLRVLATLVLAIAAIEALLDYALKAQAAAQYPDSEQLVSFFTIFYAATAMLSLVVQTLGSGVALNKLGLAGLLPWCQEARCSSA